ncbi:endonuclease/exonuclease/phosphatase family protein [Streptomyces poriferorum]|uniref:Endonuclease/exonuclease/phosphatase family protein n=1 Tax=Streptomyces poriferorum TaxID=2798799 RepID=A0ABY9IJU6_9ACTN|nr:MULTISPECIES: endonuclease/exonuclease/phosphatase family protein [unclassified Streptomyces]MDP5317294.1 endonuclease/exonuclease/phosphatase family protein [Streptomyces sp. Alt4]WLQ55552.1 endonuclease/exonuclease/phosphatase family protein [Streptomyces sp. Alt2]
MLRRTGLLHGPPPSSRRRARQLLLAGPLAGIIMMSAACHTVQDELPEKAPRHVLVATWNMCGVQQWNCQGTGSGSQKAEALKRLATDGGAQVIMLQEACAGDLAVARKKLGENWQSAFKAYRYFGERGSGASVRCADDGQGAAGIAILASSPLSAVSEPLVRQPSVGLHRGILCVTVAAKHLRACNAHLSLPGGTPSRPGPEFRDDQLKSLVGAADAQTVFGGDLNSAPPSARDSSSWIWPYELYRRYRECDQPSPSSRGGRATHVTGHKVDYLFTALRRAGCSVRDTGASDHWALVMRVRAG